MRNARNYMLAIGSGIILAVAYTPFSFEALAWAGIILLLFVLNTLTRDKKQYARLFWVGFAAGIAYFSILLRWLWSAYPLDWAGISNGFLGFLVVLFVWSVTIFVFALFWGLFFFAYGKLASLSRGAGKLSTTRQFLLLPALFTLTEYLRAWSGNIIWWGNGTLWQPNWTLGNLAYLFHNNTLILQLAPFLGIYGITMLVVAIGALLSLLVLRRKERGKAIIILFFIIMFLSYAPSFIGKIIKTKKTYSENTIPVAVIQTKFPSSLSYSFEEKLADFERYIQFLGDAAKQTPLPRIVLFPEGANFFTTLLTFYDAPRMREFFTALFPEETLVIDSNTIRDGSDLVSRTAYINSKKGIVQIYDKQFLTPFGEYMPYLFRGALWIIHPQTLRQFSISRKLKRGTASVPVGYLGEVGISTLVCSELFAHSLFQDSARQNAQIFLIQTSTGVFQGSTTLIQQNLAMAKFRSAENRKETVLAANFGISYHIDSRGKLKKIAQDSSPQLFTTNAVPNTEKTWYNAYGDLPFLLISLGMLLPVFWHLRKRYKK